MNPATRLHALLRAIKNDQNNRPMRKVIAELFGIADPRSPHVFRSYVTIIDLSLEVEERVRTIPALNHGLYLKCVSSLQRHLSTTNIDSDLNSFKAGIREEDLHGLEFVFDLLDGVESEREISTEELARFDKKISQLMEEVQGSHLDHEFRRFLLANLSVIHVSIRNYRFFGSAGVHAALARVVGEVVLDSRDAHKSDEKKSMMQRVIGVMRDINAAVIFVRNGVEIAKTIQAAEFLKIQG